MGGRETGRDENRGWEREREDSDKAWRVERMRSSAIFISTLAEPERTPKKTRERRNMARRGGGRGKAKGGRQDDG